MYECLLLYTYLRKNYWIDLDETLPKRSYYNKT